MYGNQKCVLLNIEGSSKAFNLPNQSSRHLAIPVLSLNQDNTKGGKI